MLRITGPALAVVLLMASWAPASSALDIGDKAPTFAIPDLRNRHVLSREYLEAGYVILDFFATDPGGSSVLTPYFQRRPTPLTVLANRYRVTVKKYRVGEIPTLFLVNIEGLIAYRQVGFTEDLYDRIRSLLGD